MLMVRMRRWIPTRYLRPYVLECLPANSSLMLTKTEVNDGVAGK